MNVAIALLAGRRPYSPGAALAEASAAVHMTRSRQSTYHILYGDTDARLLPIASRALRCRTVATFHEPPRVLKDWGIGRRAIRHLSDLILLSETQREYFAPLFPRAKTHVVPHSIDTAFYAPPPHARRSRLCLVVGEHLRDHELLRSTMERVWRAERRVTFVLIGVQVPVRGAPSGRLVVRSRITDGQLLAWYHAATVALFTFSDLTASNALLEAMATATPIVANAVPAIHEYAGTGADLRPSRPQDLAAGVLDMIADSERGRVLGEAARARAERLDHAAVAPAMLAIYGRVADA